MGSAVWWFDAWQMAEQEKTKTNCCGALDRVTMFMCVRETRGFVVGCYPPPMERQSAKSRTPLFASLTFEYAVYVSLLSWCCAALNSKFQNIHKRTSG
jgi:hypothetical protein